MPVDSQHTDYTRRLTDVKKVRDFNSESVISYVKRMPGHDDSDYKFYSEGAYYLPALGRTVDAFVGMVMSPSPSVTGAPDAFDPFLDDLTNDGEPLSRFASTVIEEVILTARGVALVDYPDKEEGENVTRLDAEALGLRPYARFYKFEDVINWKVSAIDGRRILTELRLIESYEEPGDDEWDSVSSEQIRVLDIFEGFYRVRVFRKKDAEAGSSGKKLAAGLGGGTRGSMKQDSWEQWGEDRFPMSNGIRLQEIPAVVFGPSSLDPSRMERPPIMEMVGISCSHLNDSAHRQWAIMWCGSPTLVIAGQPAKDANSKPVPIRVGSSNALLLGKGSTADLLEANGDAVGAIKESMDDKRRDMAAVGARILIDSGSSAISTETARMERAGEHSVLAELSNTASDGLTKVLKLIADWAGIESKDIRVSLNSDYLPQGLQTGELTEWVNAVQSGLMPVKVFVSRLKERGVVEPEMTEEDYLSELEKDADDLGLGNGDETDEERAAREAREAAAAA